MSPLETFAREIGMPLERLLDVLQLAGVISDNCIGVETVALADQWTAIRWCKQHKVRG